MERDAFICHKSTDKTSVVRPLVELLRSHDISCWIDEAEIVWGDSLTQKVNEGLRASRYVVVVLSESFLQQSWPEKELYSALDLEAASGKSKVLPLMVGSPDDHHRILQHYPLLSGKKYMKWPQDRDRLVRDMQALLKKRSAQSDRKPVSEPDNDDDIHVPAVKRRPTELDSHRFARDGHKIIREYFQSGMSRLKEANPHIEIDFNDVHSSKFVCEVFVEGARKARCKIWLGGISGSSEQISYSESFSSVDEDNSYNDWITVSREELAWESSGLQRHVANQDRSGMTHREAAQHFWRQFVEPLERG